MATDTFIIDIRTRGTKRSARDVRRIGAAATQVRKTLAFLRNALVAVAAIRVFGSLTSSLVEFSDAMLVVKAVTRATNAEFVRLRDVAKGLGATTRFTASGSVIAISLIRAISPALNPFGSGIRSPIRRSSPDASECWKLVIASTLTEYGAVQSSAVSA